MSQHVLSSITPISSPSDPKQYRAIVIGNHLRVLLISDPDTPSCAAAMTCGVGNLSDPFVSSHKEDESVQPLHGLTHLLEHMLFLGTTKYPQDGEYKHTVNKYGGTRNASTSSETTTYQFDVPTQYFLEVLDRFAQFFISPLLDKHRVEREIKVVNSEHNKNLVNESRRHRCLLQKALVQDHPYSQFHTGNTRTLVSVPHMHGIDVHNTILAHYKQHYYANNMCLVVYSNMGLDELSSIVVDLFLSIPSRPLENSSEVSLKEAYSVIGNLWYQPSPSNGMSNQYPQRSGFPQLGRIVDPYKNPHQLLQMQNQSLAGCVFEYVPLTESRQITLTWFLPPLLFWESQPLTFFFHLVNYRGVYSLPWLLKGLQYATACSFSLEYCLQSGSAISCHVSLTQKGLAHGLDIIRLIYAFLTLVKKTMFLSSKYSPLVSHFPEEPSRGSDPNTADCSHIPCDFQHIIVLYDELCRIMDINFQYKRPSSSIRALCVDLSKRMLSTPQQYYVSNSQLIYSNTWRDRAQVASDSSPLSMVRPQLYTHHRFSCQEVYAAMNGSRGNGENNGCSLSTVDCNDPFYIISVILSHMTPSNSIIRIMSKDIDQDKPFLNQTPQLSLSHPVYASQDPDHGNLSHHTPLSKKRGHDEYFNVDYGSYFLSEEQVQYILGGLHSSDKPEMTSVDLSELLRIRPCNQFLPATSTFQIDSSDDDVTQVFIPSFPSSVDDWPLQVDAPLPPGSLFTVSKPDHHSNKAMFPTSLSLQLSNVLNWRATIEKYLQDIIASTSIPSSHPVGLPCDYAIPPAAAQAILSDTMGTLSDPHLPTSCLSPGLFEQLSQLSVSQQHPSRAALSTEHGRDSKSKDNAMSKVGQPSSQVRTVDQVFDIPWIQQYVPPTILPVPIPVSDVASKSAVHGAATPPIELWYKPTAHHHPLPHAKITFALTFPTLSHFQLRVFSFALTKHIEQFTYDALCLESHIAISMSGHQRLEIGISGYSVIIPKLLAIVLREFYRVPIQLLHDSLDRIIRSFKSQTTARAIDQASSYLSAIRWDDSLDNIPDCSHSFHFAVPDETVGLEPIRDDEISSPSEVGYTDEHNMRLLSELESMDVGTILTKMTHESTPKSAIMLVMGSIHPHYAIRVSQFVFFQLSCSSISLMDIPRKSHIVPHGASTVLCPQMNKNDTQQACIQSFFLTNPYVTELLNTHTPRHDGASEALPKTCENTTMTFDTLLWPLKQLHIELFAHLCKSHLNNHLRTQQQLGYLVSAQTSLTPAGYVWSITIQSEHHPLHLSQSIRSYIRCTLLHYLCQLTTQQWEESMSGYQDRLLKRYENLFVEANVWWLHVGGNAPQTVLHTPLLHALLISTWFTDKSTAIISPEIILQMVVQKLHPLDAKQITLHLLNSTSLRQLVDAGKDGVQCGDHTSASPTDVGASCYTLSDYITAQYSNLMPFHDATFLRFYLPKASFW